VKVAAAICADDLDGALLNTYYVLHIGMTSPLAFDSVCVQDTWLVHGHRRRSTTASHCCSPGRMDKLRHDGPKLLLQSVASANKNADLGSFAERPPGYFESACVDISMGNYIMGSWKRDSTYCALDAPSEVNHHMDAVVGPRCHTLRKFCTPRKLPGLMHWTRALN